MKNPVLSRIIRVIVETADPDTIILFGSRAEHARNDDTILCNYTSTHGM